MLIETSSRLHADQTRQQLIAIIESSEDAILSMDLSGIVASWNRGAEQILGYRADEIIENPITMLIPPDLQDEESAILKRIRNGDRIDHYETVRRRKDGNLVEISLTVSPIKDAKEKIVGASKIARDISERRQAERQAAELSEQLVALQDEERGHIVEKLLDSTTQHLVAIGLKSMELRSSLVAIEGEARRCLDKIDGAVKLSQKELHAAIFRLQPPRLRLKICRRVMRRRRA